MAALAVLVGRTFLLVGSGSGGGNGRAAMAGLLITTTVVDPSAPDRRHLSSVTAQETAFEISP